MTYVFVYGTLKRGYGSNALLADAKFEGKGEVWGFTLYPVSSFPGAVAARGRKVRGELYQVDQETMDSLDRLEGFPTMYRREQVEVWMDDYGDVTAWIYVWNSVMPGVGTPGDTWENGKVFNSNEEVTMEP